MRVGGNGDDHEGLVQRISYNQALVSVSVVDNVGNHEDAVDGDAQCG